MAEPGTTSKRGRPLSPHLSDGWKLHWKPGPAMAVSILHRISGDGLALVGLPLLLWWLYAVASGPAAYETFTHWVWSAKEGHPIQAVTAVLGKIVLVGLSWAFFEHLLSGLRHFVLDIGAGYELKTNAIWSWVVLVGSIILTAGFWLVILKPWGA